MNNGLKYTGFVLHGGGGLDVCVCVQRRLLHAEVSRS